jgi:hypothetical protein
MSFAEEVAARLKNELKMTAKTIYNYEEKENLILAFTRDEFIQIMAYKRGFTGKKYYLSWAMPMEQARQYLPLVKKMALEKEDVKFNPLEKSIDRKGHIAIAISKKMLLHLVIKETSRLEAITVGWVFKGVRDFAVKMHTMPKS